MEGKEGGRGGRVLLCFIRFESSDVGGVAGSWGDFAWPDSEGHETRAKTDGSSRTHQGGVGFKGSEEREGEGGCDGISGGHGTG